MVANDSEATRAVWSDKFYAYINEKPINHKTTTGNGYISISYQSPCNSELHMRLNIGWEKLNDVLNAKNAEQLDEAINGVRLADHELSKDELHYQLIISQLSLKTLVFKMATNNFRPGAPDKKATPPNMKNTGDVLYAYDFGSKELYSQPVK